MTPAVLKGIKSVRKSREADRLLGSLSDQKAQWLLQVIRDVALGEIAVNPSLLYPNLYYVSPDDIVTIVLSVAADVMVVLDISP